MRLLDFAPGDLQRAANDTDGHLVPRLRALNAPLAIFIDGIDEYFGKHVEQGPASPSVTGELSPNVWYFAQLGLVEVADGLGRQHVGDREFTHLGHVQHVEGALAGLGTSTHVAAP